MSKAKIVQGAPQNAPTAPADATVPVTSPALCVAGIGASAGGFDAIRRFFQTMPTNSGVAFVLVQNPQTAEYDGMPRSAIAAGAGDEAGADTGITESRAADRAALLARKDLHESQERSNKMRMLSAALAMAGTREMHKLDVPAQDDGQPKPMNPAVSATLFRAVRELLTHIAKHAGVTQATATIARDPIDTLLLGCAPDANTSPRSQP